MHGVFSEKFFVSVHRFIRGGAFCGVGNHALVPYDKVWSDDDADIVKLKPLAGVDAAHLVYRVWLDNPSLAVRLKVPSRVKVINDRP